MMPNLYLNISVQEEYSKMNYAIIKFSPDHGVAIPMNDDVDKVFFVDLEYDKNHSISSIRHSNTFNRKSFEVVADYSIQPKEAPKKDVVDKLKQEINYFQNQIKCLQKNLAEVQKS